ncbi:T9SS type A sorting domain-containing protein [Flavobacterium terrisoli]|uniref:T9SS type A sorting domain-containing protein n=1 Tax=Flavobacterium terrisoli TaxID=3242195 RepID=UPI002543C41E|nr:T9SS type A sorting domain-containing protein [Flavobacterium buctense]
MKFKSTFLQFVFVLVSFYATAQCVAPPINCPANIEITSACATTVSVPGPEMNSPVLDQSNLSTNINMFFGSTMCQSFTAGITGLLKQVDVGIISCNGSGVLEIYDGGVSSSGAPTGTLRYSQLISIQLNTTNSYVLTPAINVEFGHQYTIMIGSTNILAPINWQNPYPGGNIGYDESDLVFRTYVIPPYTITNNLTDTSDASGIYDLGTTSVVWTAVDVCGNSSSCTQTVTLNTPPTAVGGTVNSDTSLCFNNSGTQLSLAGNTGQVIRWESATVPFATWNPITNTSDTYTTPPITETTQFRAVVSTGLCSEAVSSAATVTINNPPGATMANAINVSTRNYTTSGNNLAANCFFNTTGALSPDVWYKVNLESCAMRLSANTCTGTNYDSVLRVYAEDGATLLAYNDDSCGVQSTIDLNIFGRSYVYVIVEGYYINTGNYGLNIVVTVADTTTFEPISAVCPGTVDFPLPSTSLEGASGTWSPAFNNTATTTYTFNPNIACAPTATVTIEVLPPVGNPTVFGNNVWNVYAWNTGDSYDDGQAWNANYAGYYTASGTDFNTQNQWGLNSSPSAAPGYQGCFVRVDNHSWSAKRQGFPSGYYSIDIDTHDDWAELWINGTRVWIDTGCCDFHSNVWTGFLGPNDKVEFKTTEGVGLSVGAISFHPALPTITASGSTTICDNSTVLLTASAGPGYLWSNGATTQSIIVSSAGNYSVQITNAPDFVSTSSLPVVVNVIQAPMVNITGNATVSCGQSVTLSGNGADNYVWNIYNTTSAPPLNTVTNATLALGLRKLKSSYAGFCIRLRRSTDNAEMDFGFSGNHLDMAAINTWLNGATGYCVTLYDQSGSGGDVSNNNISYQPSFTIRGEKPILHFSFEQFLYNLTYYAPSYTAIYGARQTGGERQRVLSATSNNWLLGFWGGAKGQAYFDGWLTSNPGNPPADNNFYIYSGASDGNTSQFYENGILLENNSNGVSGPQGIQLNGSGLYGEYSDCDFTDVMLFDSVLSNANRALVENSIKNYYELASTPNITVSPTATTTYTVTGTSANGCSATASHTVTLIPDSWYQDSDNDGYGNPDVTILSCTQPVGYVANNSDCDDTKLAVHPNATEICFNGIDDDCDGLFSEGCPPALTSILPSFCGNTLPKAKTTITASAATYSGPYAVSYLFRITNLSVMPHVTVDLPRAFRNFNLGMTDILAYNSQYSVMVAAVVNGEQQPFSAPCIISTPSIPNTKLVHCGGTITSMSSSIACNSVSYAIGYQFEVALASNPGVVKEFTRFYNNFSMIMAGSAPNALPLTYDTDYIVRARAKVLIDGEEIWGVYGEPCTITTPPAPEAFMTACDEDGITPASMSTILYANIVNYTSMYRFTLYNDTGYSQSVEHTYNFFRLNDFAALSPLTPGATYSIYVDVMLFGNYYSGKDCQLIVPFPAKTELIEMPFEAKAYPNPFGESFMIEVRTESETVIDIKVYDMVGRLIEQRKTNVSEMETTTIGDQYPSGVYNVVITQDEEVKTLRVVKR